MNSRKKTVFISSFLSYDINDEFSSKKPALCPWNKPDRSLFCLKKHNRFRKFIRIIVESKIFESVIMLAIFANCIVLSLTTMYSNNDSNSLNEKLELSEPYFLAIFLIECIMKIIIYGFVLHPKSYLRSFWNILDFSVVALGFLTIILTSLNQSKIDVKAIRAFRVLRPLRLVSRLPSLQLVLNSILIAMRPLADIGVLVLFVIIIFAIIGINLFMGIFQTTCYSNVTYQMTSKPVPCSMDPTIASSYTCDKVPPLIDGQEWICLYEVNNSQVTKYPGPNYGITNFDHMGFAILTVFQIITRQGWTDVMYWTNNIYGNTWPWIYYISLVLIGSYFVLNLIIGVLCGEFTKEKLKVERRMKYLKETQNLKIKTDYINYKTWIESTEKNENNSLDAVSVDQGDNDRNSISTEGSTKNILKGFVKKIQPLRKKIQQKILTTIKSRIYFIIILVLVFVNTAILATSFANQPNWLTQFQNYSNLFFIIIFTIEMLIKLFALGFKKYFEKLFNIYDFIIITLSIIEMGLTFTNVMDPIGISVLRSLRLLRIFKLTKFWSSLKNLVNNMIDSMKSILSLLLLLGLFIIIASLLGMQLFGGKYDFDPNLDFRSNFDDIIQAIITVFQIVTTELWNVEMYNGIKSLGGANSVGSIGSIYYISVVIIGNYILLNAFFAIVLEILNRKETKVESANIPEEDDFDAIELEQAEKELDVPVTEKLVVINGIPMMPPTYKNDIKALNMVKSKTRRRAALERRARIVIQEEEAEENFENLSLHKVNFKELYAEEEETAIEIDVNNNVQDESESFVVVEDDSAVLPTGSSCYIFKPNNRFRIFCYKFINHSLTKNLILVIIICSSLMLAFYDPLNNNIAKNNMLGNFDYFFTAVFILELLINLVAYGVIFHTGAYLRNAFNWVDLIVVGIAILNIFIEAQISALKSIRVFRVIKTLRTIRGARELKHVINSLVITIKHIWRILLVMLLLLIMFAIIGVIIFKGSFYSCSDISQKTKDECMGTFISYSYDRINSPVVKNRTWTNYPLNFDNVFQAIFTLFTISSYQGYPELLYRSIDSTKENVGPYMNNNKLIFLYYCIYIIVIRLFMLNIFIGFIVLSYQESRETEFKSDALDKNQKQCISYVLKIRPMFRYVPTVYYRYRIWKIVTSKTFDNFIFLIIILNTISMSMVYDKASNDYLSVLTYLNYIFIILFTLEAFLKILAFNIRNYFDDKMNIFDCIVVLGSYVDIAFMEINTDQSAFSINIFRLFRVLRLVKLLMKSKSILKILWTFIRSFKTFPWVILLIAIIFYAYSIIGLQFFGKIALNNPNSAIDYNNNFQTLINTFLVLFRCLTGENWQKIMISCIDSIESRCENSTESCGNPIAYFFFPSFTFLLSYLIINLFLAVIIDNFDYLTKDNSILSPHHLEEFIEKWSDYDIGGRGRIKPLDLINLLTKINPPLGFGKMCSHEKCMQKLIALNMPLEKDGTILIHGALFALLRKNLKIKMPQNEKDPKSIEIYNEELRHVIRKLWPNADPSLVDQLLPNVKDNITVGKFYATFIIQDMFRKWKFRQKDKKMAKIMKITNDDKEPSITRHSVLDLSSNANYKENIETPIDTVDSTTQNERPIETFWKNFKNIFTVPDDKDFGN